MDVKCGYSLGMDRYLRLVSDCKNHSFTGNLSTGNNSHNFEELLDIAVCIAAYRGAIRSFTPACPVYGYLTLVAHNLIADMLSICCVKRVEMLELDGARANLVKQTLACA
jgi:hypothetical protein